jgi:hypothetical protein|tara:strand:- start:198 stop:368 length:171 start_codon:yes stop_codon:yes gene_type:complete
MNITNAQYFQDNEVNVSINCTIDGKPLSVPLDPANRHYAEILKQVAEKKLTIKDAD